MLYQAEPLPDGLIFILLRHDELQFLQEFHLTPWTCAEPQHRACASWDISKIPACTIVWESRKPVILVISNVSAVTAGLHWTRYTTDVVEEGIRVDSVEVPICTAYEEY